MKKGLLHTILASTLWAHRKLFYQARIEQWRHSDEFLRNPLCHCWNYSFRLYPVQGYM